jgi:hypothetical protein
MVDTAAAETASDCLPIAAVHPPAAAVVEGVVAGVVEAVEAVAV